MTGDGEARWPAVASLGEVLIDLVALETDVPVQEASTIATAKAAADLLPGPIFLLLLPEAAALHSFRDRVQELRPSEPRRLSVLRLVRRIARRGLPELRVRDAPRVALLRRLWLRAVAFRHRGCDPPLVEICARAPACGNDCT